MQKKSNHTTVLVIICICVILLITGLVFIKRKQIRRIWIRRKLSSNYYTSIEDDEEHLVDTAENVAIAEECVIRGSNLSSGSSVEWHSPKKDDDLLSGDALGFGSDEDSITQSYQKQKKSVEKRHSKPNSNKSSVSKNKSRRYREESDDDILI